MTKAARANSTCALVAHPPAGAASPGTPASPSPRRRGLLAGAAAALAAAPFAAHAAQLRTVGALARDAGPDAALLTLHRDFLAHHVVVEAWNAGFVSEDAGEAAHDRWWECVQAITAIRATTPAGMQAKAEVALLAYETAGGHGGPDEDLVRAALRDVVGRAA